MPILLAFPDAFAGDTALAACLALKRNAESHTRADADKMSALRRSRLTARKNCQAPSVRCRRYYLTNTMNALLPAGSRVAVFGTFAFQQYRPADCDQQQNS